MPVLQRLDRRWNIKQKASLNCYALVPFTDMLPPDDPFLTNFNRTFIANYDPGTFQEELRVPTADHTPISFYDHHIASNLLLKDIVYLPSFARILSKAFERTVQSFLAAGHRFSSDGYSAFTLECESKTFVDARNVLRHYLTYMAHLGSVYASKLILHPDSSIWDSVFRLGMKGVERGLTFTAESWLEIDSLLKDQAALYDSLDQSTKEKLKELERKFPRLAIWDMFAMTDTAMEMFKSITRSGPFNWQMCHTQGSSSVSHLPIPPDAKTGFLHASSKSKQSARTNRGVITKTSKTIVIPRLPSRRRLYRPDLQHYIQHVCIFHAQLVLLDIHCFSRPGRQLQSMIQPFSFFIVGDMNESVFDIELLRRFIYLE